MKSYKNMTTQTFVERYVKYNVIDFPYKTLSHLRKSTRESIDKSTKRLSVDVLECYLVLDSVNNSVLSKLDDYEFDPI